MPVLRFPPSALARLREGGQRGAIPLRQPQKNETTMIAYKITATAIDSNGVCISSDTAEALGQTSAYLLS